MDNDPASRWNHAVWGERLRKEYTPLLPVFKELKVALVSFSTWYRLYAW